MKLSSYYLSITSLFRYIVYHFYIYFPFLSLIYIYIYIFFFKKKKKKKTGKTITSLKPQTIDTFYLSLLNSAVVALYKAVCMCIYTSISSNFIYHYIEAYNKFERHFVNISIGEQAEKKNVPFFKN